VIGEEIVMERDEAYKLLLEYVKTDYLVKHCLATEAIMRALAEKFGEDVEKWGIAGLLHDLDFDLTEHEPSKHTIITEELLQARGFDEESINAIKAHNAEETGSERKSVFDHALTAAESVTGLIVATALVQPDKKLSSVKPESVIKRMKKKDFARKVSRERIQDCQGTGLSLEEFVELSVQAMQKISNELGL